jgi:hypothetical protein
MREGIKAVCNVTACFLNYVRPARAASPSCPSLLPCRPATPVYSMRSAPHHTGLASLACDFGVAAAARLPPRLMLAGAAQGRVGVLEPHLGVPGARRGRHVPLLLRHAVRRILAHGPRTPSHCLPPPTRPVRERVHRRASVRREACAPPSCPPLDAPASCSPLACLFPRGKSLAPPLLFPPGRASAPVPLPACASAHETPGVSPRPDPRGSWSPHLSGSHLREPSRLHPHGRRSAPGGAAGGSVGPSRWTGLVRDELDGHGTGVRLGQCAWRVGPVTRLGAGAGCSPAVRRVRMAACCLCLRRAEALRG